MKAFAEITSTFLPLDRNNVDTDAIIPQQYLKSVKRTGFGVNLFDNWRYQDPGILGQDHSKRRLHESFVLNQKQYQGAKILLARENFGCGSSREHAVWSILDYGFEVVIAPSFADIFCSNCYKNGLLPITLSASEVDYLFEQVNANSNYECNVNLDMQMVNDENKKSFSFQIDEFRKYCLVNGYDEIDLTLQHADKIKEYESKLKQTSPWLFSAK